MIGKFIEVDNKLMEILSAPFNGYSEHFNEETEVFLIRDPSTYEAMFYPAFYLNNSKVYDNAG